MVDSRASIREDFVHQRVSNANQPRVLDFLPRSIVCISPIFQAGATLKPRLRSERVRYTLPAAKGTRKPPCFCWTTTPIPPLKGLEATPHYTPQQKKAERPLSRFVHRKRLSLQSLPFPPMSCDCVFDHSYHHVKESMRGVVHAYILRTSSLNCLLQRLFSSCRSSHAHVSIILQLLLSRKADLHARDDRGRVPLQVTTSRRCAERLREAQRKEERAAAEEEKLSREAKKRETAQRREQGYGTSRWPLSGTTTAT